MELDVTLAAGLLDSTTLQQWASAAATCGLAGSRGGVVIVVLLASTAVGVMAYKLGGRARPACTP